MLRRYFANNLTLNFRNGCLSGLVCCVLMFVGFGGRVYGADIGRVPVLQDSLRVWVGKRDSLRQEQAVVQVAVDRLAAEMDVLKQGHGEGTATGPLAVVLRQSLALALKLERLYGEETTVGRQVVRIESALREAYDFEIDRLIVLLGEEPDTTLVQRLLSVRRARQVLNRQAEKKALPTVTIGADDTPDDIRLKAEFMADVALQVQQEQADVKKELTRLLEEQRLRSRAATFTNEFGLFDEASPQGRSVSTPVVADSENKLEEVNPPPEFGFAGIAGPAVESGSEATILPPKENLPTTFDLGREITLDGMVAVGGDTENALEMEIRKLRLRQAALASQEKQAQDRAERLARYLKQLLEGQNP